MDTINSKLIVLGTICLFLMPYGCGKPSEEPQMVPPPSPVKTVRPEPVVRTVTPPPITEERKETSPMVKTAALPQVAEEKRETPWLKNGSFEEWPSDDAKLAEDWVSLYGQPIQAGRSTEAKEGKFAQWVSGSDPNKRAGVLQIFDDPKSFAGKQVKISGFVRAAEAPVEVTVQFVGERADGTNPYFAQKKVNAEFAWQQFELLAAVPKDIQLKNVYVAVFFDKVVGKFEVDDLKME